MECSPTSFYTILVEEWDVAVPIKNGMLSYEFLEELDREENVAVPIKNGMLSYFPKRCKICELFLSQSPSKMECSPTFLRIIDTGREGGRSPHQKWNALLRLAAVEAKDGQKVAVPIKNGMLSYSS